MRILVSAKSENRKKTRAEFDKMPFNITIGNRRTQQYRKLLDYFAEQEYDYERPKEVSTGEETPSASHDHLILRPPRNLVQNGIYTGEWNIETMTVEGYGFIQYSAQFNSFYKKGYFVDGKLHGEGKQSWQRFEGDKVIVCEQGVFNEGTQFNGLSICRDEVLFADKDACEEIEDTGAEFKQSFDFNSTDDSVSIFKKWSSDSQKVEFGIFR